MNKSNGSTNGDSAQAKTEPDINDGPVYVSPRGGVFIVTGHEGPWLSELSDSQMDRSLSRREEVEIVREVALRETRDPEALFQSFLTLVGDLIDTTAEK